MEDCVFCKIVKEEIPRETILETNNFIVIPDIKPSAKTHLLIISKRHIDNLKSSGNDLLIEPKNIALDLQKKLILEEFQFRVNWGKLLEINHLHFHLLAGFNN